MKPKHVLEQLASELEAFVRETHAECVAHAEQGRYALAAAVDAEASAYNRVLCRLAGLREAPDA